MYELDDFLCVCLGVRTCCIFLLEGLLLPREVYALRVSCPVVFFREERDLLKLVVFPEYFFAARLLDFVYRFATYVSDPFCFE